MVKNPVIFPVVCAPEWNDIWKVKMYSFWAR